jgi:hypothetical protein
MAGLTGAWMLPLIMMSGSSTEDQLFHDVRSVHDMAEVRAADLRSRNDDRTFVLLRITPAPGSGGATPDGAIREEGAWQLLAPAERSGGPTEGRYQWSIAQSFHKQGLDAGDLYSPFSKGGAVLARRGSVVRGATRFDPVYLVPAPWEASLLSAVPGGGPLAPIDTFRSALTAGKVNGKSLRAALDGAPGYGQAILVYLVLSSRPPARSTAALLPEIARRIEGGAAPADQKWSTLGAFTAVMLDPARATAAQDLMRRVPREQAAVDPYLQEMMRVLDRSRPAQR